MIKVWRSAMVALLAVLPAAALAQGESGIDPEALIERLLAVDQEQRDQIKDVTFDAEYVELEGSDTEQAREKVRFVKKVYLKYLPDTVWYREEYLRFFKEGEEQSEENLDKEARDRMEKKAKRKARDISYPMLKPFYSEQRSLYQIDYLGVARERVQDQICHQFRVTAIQKADSLINGDFYFEADGFHLVQVDFAPSKLVKKVMFRMNELAMTIIYGPSADGFWLPRQFDIRGKGKAAFFFGVNFSGTEYYTNARINSGLEDALFEVSHGD